MIYRLIMVSGPLQGQRFTVEKNPMVIGRDADCAIVIPDPEIAKKHAVIEQTAVGVFVHDLGSMTRILVNGREVHESRLKHGDEVGIGHSRFVVQALVESEVEKPARPRRRRRRLWAVVTVLAGVAAASILVRTLQRPPPRPVPSKRVPKREIVAGPTSVVERSATVSTGAVSAPLPAPASTNEIEAMKRDLIGIRRIVNDLATRQPTTAVVEVRAPAPPPKAEPPTEQPAAKAQRLLAESRREAAAGNLVSADRLLEQLQAEQPGFLPAYEERGALFERRGMVDEAVEQWLEIIDRGAAGALYEKAAEEYYRLDRLDVRRSSTVPVKIRIVQAEHQKFPESEDQAEMRTVSVQLKMDSGTNEPPEAVSPVDVQVEVLFFDQDPASGRIAPTRALVPKERLRPEEPLRAGAPNTVTATYVMTRAARAGAAGQGPQTQYYGYVVRVYYRGELQDEDAMPKSLLHYSIGGRHGRNAD